MASVSLTITSNNVGVVTSSFVVDDQDLQRILLALKANYQEQVDNSHYEREDDKPELNVSYVWGTYAYQVVQGLINSVLQRETADLYKSVQDQIKQIDVKNGGQI